MRAAMVALALLQFFCGAASAADEVKIGGTGSALGTMRLLAEKFSQINPGIKITTVGNLGSAGGIKAAGSGAIDLAVSSRSLNASERKLGLSELEFARTPFVFAVSTKSTVSAITRHELAGIYSGRILKWPDGSAIRVVLRPPSDIDTEIVKEITPALGQAVAAAERRPGVRFSVTDQDAAGDLERIPGAIGPSSLSLILSERRTLRALTLDGVEPTPANAVSGDYPLYKRMSFVTGAKSSAAVERFVAFVQSPAGRKVLNETGHWVP